MTREQLEVILAALLPGQGAKVRQILDTVTEENAYHIGREVLGKMVVDAMQGDAEGMLKRLKGD